MSLETLPDLTLIVAPIKSGKTQLIRYLLLKNHKDIAAVLLFSNTGVAAYEANYNFLNPRYIRDEFDPTLLNPTILALASEIRQHDPTKRIVVIFDDSVGMAKSLFAKEESKRLLTTMRHYGISLIVSTQQLQTEVSTLIRNNAQEIFLFQQSDPGGLNIAHETWGKGSANLRNKDEFEDTIRTLPKHTFMHYTKEISVWSRGQIPYPLPDFRIRLHPDDDNVKGMQVIYGNKEDYDLSSIEKDLSIMEVKKKSNKPLFRVPKDSKPDHGSISGDSDLDNDDMQFVSDDDDIVDTPSKVKKSKKDKKPKKRKRDIKPESDEEDQDLLPPIELNLSKKDNTIRFRSINQLRFASNNPIIRPKVEEVFPDFFVQEFETMPYEQLRANRKKLHSAFQVHGVVNAVQNQYNLLGTFLQKGIEFTTGYSGPGLNLIPSLYQEQMAMSTLHSLGKLNPYEKQVQEPWEKVLDLVYPAVNIWNKCNDQVHFANQVEKIGEEMVDSDLVDEIRAQVQK